MEKILRQIIREMALSKSEPKAPKAAGVVVVKFFNGVPKVLILKRFDGTYDITKGKIEKDESSLATAEREAFEEAGLNDLVFLGNHDSIRYGKGEVFVAITESDPIILPNPETGQFEHTSFKFISFEKAEKLVDDKLKEAIRWAQSKIMDYGQYS